MSRAPLRGGRVRLEEKTMESYLGYPLFLWQGLTSLLSLLVAGLVIAFVTTFYLKRKMVFAFEH